MKAYYEGRKEKTITERHGSYRLTIRYFENSNKAQATMEDIAALRFPILWSHTLTDEQANAALDIFKAVGFFDIPIMERG
jgi:hypothetical protein